MQQPVADVNTVVYGADFRSTKQRSVMADQLSAKDWLDQGLRALAKHGFTALKAEPLAKAMGVSRGSFYWHFADIAAFHRAILEHWRDVAVERIIADIEALPPEGNALQTLLTRAFGGKPPLLESAMRSWAARDRLAQSAVQAVDQRRMGYIEKLLRDAGWPAEAARARTQILYWAFLGFALSDKPPSPARKAAITVELLRIATHEG
jgi:AcrR family transcriptional regulator